MKWPAGSRTSFGLYLGSLFLSEYSTRGADRPVENNARTSNARVSRARLLRKRRKSQNDSGTENALYSRPNVNAKNVFEKKTYISEKYTCMSPKITLSAFKNEYRAVWGSAARPALIFGDYGHVLLHTQYKAAILNLLSGYRTETDNKRSCILQINRALPLHCVL